MTLQYDDHKDGPAKYITEQQHDRFLDEGELADDAEQLDRYRQRP